MREPMNKRDMASDLGYRRGKTRPEPERLPGEQYRIRGRHYRPKRPPTWTKQSDQSYRSNDPKYDPNLNEDLHPVYYKHKPSQPWDADYDPNRHPARLIKLGLRPKLSDLYPREELEFYIFDRGYTTADLARMTGLNYRTLQYLIKKYGIKNPASREPWRTTQFYRVAAAWQLNVAETLCLASDYRTYCKNYGAKTVHQPMLMGGNCASKGVAIEGGSLPHLKSDYFEYRTLRRRCELGMSYTDLMKITGFSSSRVYNYLKRHNVMEFYNMLHDNKHIPFSYKLQRSIYIQKYTLPVKVVESEKNVAPDTNDEGQERSEQNQIISTMCTTVAQPPTEKY